MGCLAWELKFSDQTYYQLHEKEKWGSVSLITEFLRRLYLLKLCKQMNTQVHLRTFLEALFSFSVYTFSSCQFPNYCKSVFPVWMSQLKKITLCKNILEDKLDCSFFYGVNRVVKERVWKYLGPSKWSWRRDITKYLEILFSQRGGEHIIRCRCVFSFHFGHVHSTHVHQMK